MEGQFSTRSSSPDGSIDGLNLERRSHANRIIHEKLTGGPLIPLEMIDARSYRSVICIDLVSLLGFSLGIYGRIRCVSITIRHDAQWR